MIASMTGFGRAQEMFKGGSFTVEIRSVNHRFADISIRLPRSLAMLESRIKELIKNRLNRGHINFQLSWDRESVEIESLILDKEKILRYQVLFRQMSDELGIDGALTVETLSRFSDVFKTESEPEDEEKLWPIVERVSIGALDAMIHMRRSEGERLASDIIGRLAKMADYMEQANLKAPERLDRLDQRLRAKLNSALGTEEVDKTRLLTEITLYADKWDFSEEEVRFRSHLDAMRETIEKGGPVGRRLSFLAQELNREVNTVASKANDADVAQLMVAVKEEIERIREQVENIE
ncbi:MAG: YicC/YloC family endoribonuclease [Gemmatimonadota bacterium]|nr:YicC/YloC family endoribonuclease [Gemmatimonadota bacterium]